MADTISVDKIKNGEIVIDNNRIIILCKHCNGEQQCSQKELGTVKYSCEVCVSAAKKSGLDVPEMGTVQCSFCSGFGIKISQIQKPQWKKNNQKPRDKKGGRR